MLNEERRAGPGAVARLADGWKRNRRKRLARQETPALGGGHATVAQVTAQRELVRGELDGFRCWPQQTAALFLSPATARRQQAVKLRRNDQRKIGGACRLPESPFFLSRPDPEKNSTVGRRFGLLIEQGHDLRPAYPGKIGHHR